eukprot:2560582-Prymnesium_polylepis.1
MPIRIPIRQSAARRPTQNGPRTTQHTHDAYRSRRSPPPRAWKCEQEEAVCMAEPAGSTRNTAAERRHTAGLLTAFASSQ